MPVETLIYCTADEEEASSPFITFLDGKTLKADAPCEKDRTYDGVSDKISSLVSTMVNGMSSAMEAGSPAGALLYGPSYLQSDRLKLFHEVVVGAAGVATASGSVELRVSYFHRDLALDLLNTSADNLKLRVEEAKGEVVVEGSTSESISTGSHAGSVCEKAMQNLSAWCASSKMSTAHGFVLVCMGKLTVMLCAGSERVDRADHGPEGKAELEKKNGYLRQLGAMGSSIGRGDDPRAISWKESKVIKALQGPVPSAIESRGYFAFFFLVCNGKRLRIESIDTLNVAESFVRVTGLKTISEYKEIISYCEECVEEMQREKKGFTEEALKYEKDCKERQEAYDRMVAELTGKAAAIDTRIAQAKKKMESDKGAVKQEYEKKLQDVKNTARKELEEFKQMVSNSSQVAETQIREKSSKVEQEKAVYDRESSQHIASLENEYTTLKSQVESHEEKLKEVEAAERRAFATVRPLEKELFALQQELTAAGVPREEGKSESELAKLQPVWEVRDKVDELSEKVRALRIKCLRLEIAKRDGVGKPKDAASSDSSSSSSSSDSSSDDSESSSEDEEEAQERAKKEAKESYDREFKQFLATSRKEFHLKNLLEQILEYLEYGTGLQLLDNIKFNRRFFFITKDRKTLHVCEMDQNDVPIRKYPSASYQLSNVTEIILGQDTKTFTNAVTLSSNYSQVVNRGDTPPEITTLTLVTSPHFFYRSFSIVFDSGDVVDVIAESATDYEAWVVALHKLTTLDPKWIRELPIDTMDQYQALLAQEREACRLCHLPPVMYLKFKELVLCHPRLYMTLYDIRTLTNIDLFHCQRLFVFFVKQKWIDRYVFYLVHPTNKPEKVAPAQATGMRGGLGKRPPGKPGGLLVSQKSMIRKP